MWVGILWLVKLAGDPPTFDMIELPIRLAEKSIPPGCVWLIAVAFLVRMAALPLHTWLPMVVTYIPTGASILLIGGVLPLSGFGLMHVLGQILTPDMGGQAQRFVIIGLVTALGGGLASIVQRDLKRLLAFVCLSQMGIALVGIASSESWAKQGGLLMLVTVGLGGTALFLFAGVVCKARGSEHIGEIAGLWRSQPFFAGLTFAAVGSAAVIPATIGFVSAFHVLVGSAHDLATVVVLALAVLVIAISVLRTYQRVLGGSFQDDVWTKKPWPYKRQTSILALLAIVILVCGLFPGLFYV
jgi:NADH-quinone oxidoreductase subunit M